MNRPIAAPALLAAAAVLGSAPTASAHAPHDVVVAVALSPDYAQDGTVLAAIQLTEHRFMARSEDGGRSWVEVGSFAAEQLVASLELSPDFPNDQTAFAGTQKGGVFRSVDGGITWTPTSTGLRSAKVHHVSVSPAFASDGTVYAATDVGLYRSVDGGGAWAEVGAGLPDEAVHAVEFAGSPDVLFAAGEVLFRSHDGGQSWTALRDFRRTVRSLAVSPAFPTDLRLAVSFGLSTQTGVFASVDGGASFGKMDAGLTDPFVNVVAIADDGTFLAVSEGAACFRADHAFGTWTLFSEGFEEPATQTDSHYFTLDPSPTFGVDGEVFVGGHEGLFHSTDRGETWRQRDLYHQRINRFLELSPAFTTDGEVYAGNYGGGPFRFDDAVADWTPLGHGVFSLWCGALELSPAFPTDGTILYGYTGTWRSTDRGQTWTKVHAGTDVTRSIAFSPQFATDGTVIMNVASNGSFRSTDGGVSWSPLPTLPAIRMNHLRFDPGHPSPKTIYATPQQQGVLRSDDDGASWIDVSGPMAGRNVRAFQLSPDFVNDGTIVAGTVRHGLFRSNDRGGSWTPISGMPAGAGDTIESVAFSPAYATDRTLFVVSLLDGLYVSTDDGASWQPRNAGLPPDAKRVVRVSPAFATDRTVFLTTHDWTWRSADAGATWSRLPGLIRTDDKHPTVFYEGAWTKAGGGEAYGAQVTQSDQAGDAFEFEFFGDRVVWHTRTDTKSGLADVFVDGVLAATVDLFSPSVVETTPVWAKSFGVADWHVVRVAVTGQKHAHSSGFRVRSDGFTRRF